MGFRAMGHSRMRPQLRLWTVIPASAFSATPKGKERKGRTLNIYYVLRYALQGIVCTQFKFSEAIRLWNVTIFTMRLRSIRTVLLSRFCLSVRPSVCLSVKRMYCDKTKAPSDKSSVMTNRKSPTSFPMSLRWTSYVAPNPQGGLKSENLTNNLQ